MLYQQKPWVRLLWLASARGSVLPWAEHSWTTGFSSGPHNLRGTLSQWSRSRRGDQNAKDLDAMLYGE